MDINLLQRIENITEVFPEFIKNLQTLGFRQMPVNENDEEDKLSSEITISQVRALSIFTNENEPLKMSDASKKLNVCMPTATQLIDKLVNIGLLERIKDDNDRRLVLISINDKGKRIFRKTQERRRESLKWWFSKINDDEQKKLLGTIESLMEIVNKVIKYENNGSIDSEQEENR
jgi:DNA-binding MarR family transcriptional regulator